MREWIEHSNESGRTGAWARGLALRSRVIVTRHVICALEELN